MTPDALLGQIRYTEERDPHWQEGFRVISVIPCRHPVLWRAWIPVRRVCASSQQPPLCLVSAAVAWMGISPGCCLLGRGEDIWNTFHLS